ncbi:hypothetical protein CkaCkLH20_04616 [Colletotrichum karsti]|uniref:Uncharacterized protein n=1 Tax=Colletotrichum karsti TaxID=1095194 RepID=A0A9P6LM66_9PEZI|nr:uncharacterized protein CkaCkLH20_04616 [Colletotrichum karsti]KAF9878040.1 hypothetical protein CkaCkLH20_04616 [Colletotrichum karsti]
MCFFLTRHFSCVENGATVTHTHQYLVRCANPFYVDCIADGALPKMTQRYNISCHNCSGKWHHPTVAPSAVVYSPAENKEAVHRAEQSYIREMCSLIAVSTYPRWPETPDDAKRDIYPVVKQELACRFNKDHFDNGNLCDCSDTNTHPELHNISAALRQVIARCYLLPWEWQETTSNKAEFPFPGKENPRFRFIGDRLKKQPELSALNHLKAPTTIGDIGVLDFFVEPWDWKQREMHMRQSFKANCWLSWGRPEVWYNDFNDVMSPQTPLPDCQIADELDFRGQIVHKIFSLLTVDSGLSPDRAASIARVHTIIMSPDPNLLSRDQTFDEGTKRALHHITLRMPHFNHHNLTTPSVGAAWTAEDENINTAYHLRRNRDLLLSDEDSRMRAIERAVVPLTRAEFDALDEPDCLICIEAMSYPGEPHAAVRFRCPSRHYVGMNCWMKAQRKKRSVDSGRAIRCIACGDNYPLGEWPAPINLDPVFGAEHLRIPSGKLNPEQQLFDF